MHKYIGLVVATVLLVCMVACNKQPQGMDGNSAVASSTAAMTTVVLATATSLLSLVELTEQAYSNAVATNYALLSTEVAPTTIVLRMTASVEALTPYALRPTRTPYPVEPTVTRPAGIIFPEETTRNMYAGLTSQWRGMVDGEEGGIAVGWPFDGNREHYGEPTLFVYKGRTMDFDTVVERHPIPLPNSELLITLVTEGRFTIVEAVMNTTTYRYEPLPNGRRIIFDLASRQFLTPDGTPYPAATLTP